MLLLHSSIQLHQRLLLLLHFLLALRAISKTLLLRLTALCEERDDSLFFVCVSECVSVFVNRRGIVHFSNARPFVCL
jgi:hypothetical protein